MAIGFTPKHIENFPLEDLTQEQFIVIAIETAKKIGWEIGFISHTGFIAYTNNGVFSWNAEIKIKIESGIAQIKSASIDGGMMDWGKNKDNIVNFISVFNELKPSFTEEELFSHYETLKAGFVSKEEDILLFPPPTTTENITGFFSIFRPVKGYFITPVLMDINIVVFIVMVIMGVDIMSPDGDSLLLWGANFRPVTLDNEWWRLITNCFLHIGIFHLLMNMYALLYIGVLLEPYLGKTRFISAYLLTGITASVTSICWHDLIISAGASGAIFGMYGVFLAMLTTNLIEKNTRKALLTSIAVFVGYNLMYGLKGGIDNAAHLGGLAGGLIIGYAFIPGLKKPELVGLKYPVIGGLTVLVVVISFIVCSKIPNDVGRYYSKMKDFADMEDMALDMYRLPENTPKEQMLSEIKDRGIYYWNENIKLLESFSQLNLPIDIRMRNRKLIEYCRIRIKTYELIYKELDENTEIYREEIDANDIKIEAMIKELAGEKKE